MKRIYLAHDLKPRGPPPVGQPHINHGRITAERDIGVIDFCGGLP
jgi:hypothetical protein